MRPKLSIVVPTYNEADTLPKLVEAIESEVLPEVGSLEVIVVDDSSPDGTWRVAEELARSRPWLRVIVRRGLRGLSPAVAEGLLAARGEYAAVMDADLQHPPRDVVGMLRCAEATGADVVVGCRYCPGGGVEDWSRIRLALSRLAVLLAHLLVPESRATSDPVSGFFLVRMEWYRSCCRLEPSSVTRGFKILLEVLARCKPRLVADYPFTFRGRRGGGSSKLRLWHLLEYTKQLLRLNNYRVFKNMLVGVSGVVVLLAVEAALLHLGLNPRLAYPLAVESGILNNYTLNDLLVFRGRGRGKPLWRRILEYHGAVAIGALVNITVFNVALSLGLDWLDSSLAGVASGWLANYLLTEHRVFSDPRPRHVLCGASPPTQQRRQPGLAPSCSG